MKMKSLLAVVALVAACFAACTSKTAETEAAKNMDLDSLERVLATSVGDTVTVDAVLADVCCVDGKKACLVNADSSFTLCMDAAPALGTFSADLKGKTVTVTGVVREDSLTTEVLAAMVESYNEAPEAAKAECKADSACCKNGSFAARMTELFNRIDARKVAGDGKEYVSVYTLEALSCTAE